MSEFVFDGICRKCPHLVIGKACNDPMGGLITKCGVTDTYVDPMDFCRWYVSDKTEEPKNETPTVDIHKIIDDAMEKHDRSVSIFISPDGITINVYPTEPRWIEPVKEGEALTNDTY